MVTPLFSTVDNPVLPWKKNHAWTVFWCSVLVLVKDWHWRLLLGIGLAIWVYLLVFAAKYCCVVLCCIVIAGEFYRLLVVNWYVTGLWLQRVLHMKKTMDLVLWGGTCSKAWQGKPRLAVVTDQIKLSVSAI